MLLALLYPTGSKHHPLLVHQQVEALCRTLFMYTLPLLLPQLLVLLRKTERPLPLRGDSWVYGNYSRLALLYVAVIVNVFQLFVTRLAAGSR